MNFTHAKKIGTLSLSIVCALGLGFTTLADDKQTTEKKKPSKEELQERLLKNTGGWVPDRRPAKGKYVVVDVGAKMSEEERTKLLKLLERDLYYATEIKTCDAVSVKTMKDVAKQYGGTFTTFIVSEADTPALTLYPEDMTSFVNIEALKKGNLDDKTLSMRVRKELMRSLAMLMGAGYSTVGRGVMAIVRSPEDLDNIPGAMLDPMAKRTMEIIGDRFEFKPFKRSLYRILLEQGVVLQPENEYQRKIYEEYKKQTPTKPMRIMFDKNAKDGVVK